MGSELENVQPQDPDCVDVPWTREQILAILKDFLDDPSQADDVLAEMERSVQERWKQDDTGEWTLDDEMFRLIIAQSGEAYNVSLDIEAGLRDVMSRPTALRDGADPA